MVQAVSWSSRVIFGSNGAALSSVGFNAYERRTEVCKHGADSRSHVMIEEPAKRQELRR